MALRFEFCSFKDSAVEKEWRELYEKNDSASPLLSYDFNRIFYKYYSKNKSRRNMKPVLVKGIDAESGKTVMFIPLCQRGSSYYMVWDYSSVPYCGILYGEKEWNHAYDPDMFKISELLGNTAVYLTRMNDEDVYTSHLREIYTPYKKNTCIKFDILSSYDVFYKLMSKDARGNIEADRMKVKDHGHSFRTDIYFDQPLPKNVRKQIFKIAYCKSTGLTSIIKNLRSSKNSAISEVIYEGDDVVTAISYVDSEPVAFVSGVVRNGKMIVIRNAENPTGEYYSSRYLNLCDLIRYSSEKKKISEIDYGKNHDIMKLEMGGKEHSCYGFEIKL